MEQGHSYAEFDVTSVEQQIRRFLDKIGGPRTLALAPMTKESRKVVHELALAFNVKSQSKGRGTGRYTSLIKTTRSGVGINERKIAAIVRRSGGVVTTVRRGPVTTAKPREGDIVGKV